MAGLTKATVNAPIFHQLVALLTKGDVAVKVFIMLSGFVICHLLLSKKEAYLPYLAWRWFRVFPIFAICLILALLVQPLYLLMFEQSPWGLDSEMRLARATHESTYFLEHMLLHLTMLHGVLPDTIFPYSSSTFLAPAWSLSREWPFYLLAPVIVGLLVSPRWKIGASLAVICIVVAFVLGRIDALEWRYPSFLLLVMPYFLIGIASRMLIEATSFARGAFWGS